MKRTLLVSAHCAILIFFLLPNWLASVGLAAIFQFKGESFVGHRNKEACLTGQQADVYSIVLGQRSN